MKKTLFLDTETTGNEVSKDRLCQISFKDGEEIVTELFKPSLPIGIKSMSITHITNEMVEDKEPFIGSKTEAKLKELLSDHILIAHNAKFDVAILKAENINIPEYICTLRVARALDPESKIPEYNLQYLRYYLKLDLGNKEIQPHDAESDVIVLEALYNRLFEKVRGDTESDEEALEKMIQISTTPSIIRVFPFGKYKGKEVKEVAQNDRGYLEWLYKQKTEAGDDDEDWMYTLESFLK